MWLRETIIRTADVVRIDQSDQSARTECARDGGDQQLSAAAGSAARGAGVGAGAAACRCDPTASMNQELQRLASACVAAADFYCAKPEEIGAATVVDLYRTMAALASMLAQRQPPERVH